MPDFTKGPWEVEKDALHPFFYVGKVNSKTFIATVNNEANAKLIAAAPDMYYALKECYGFIENIISYDCKYCSRSLDAEGLRIALSDLFAWIHGTEDKGHDADAKTLPLLRR